MASRLDTLRLAANPKARKALASNSAGNDRVILSIKLVKINRKGKAQTRALLLTSRHVLNLMPDNYAKCNRCIDLARVHHISTCKATHEFVLHVSGEYDYRFRSPLYQPVVTAIGAAFKNATGKQLQVNEFDAATLSKQVLTKSALKSGGTRGKSEQQENTDSQLLRQDDDQNDSDDEEATDPGAEPVSPGRVQVGGAFTEGKSGASPDDFEVIRVLGKGSFGKVLLVKHKGREHIYAMKVLSKQLLLERNEVSHIKTERRALEDTHHPFLVHLRFAFQTASKLYLVMDYCNGGELFYHLKTTGRFSEPRARLYAAEITSALEHLHARKIVYRDLKPENVLLDSEGHIRVTDFGLAKDEMQLMDKTHTFCGTPDYLSPEVIKGSGHGRGVDWWSLGTMIYEMLSGLPPFYSENVNLMYEQVLRAPLEFNPPKVFSPAARKLLLQLLQKDPERRLGSSKRDAAELKEHEWFAPIDWVKLYARELEPEFKPKVSGLTDTSNFDAEFTSQPIHDDAEEDAGTEALQHFDNFSFIDRSTLAR